MSKSDEKRKAVARCENCQEIYPVRIWPDGTVHPLGSRSGCSCEQGLVIMDNDLVDE